MKGCLDSRSEGLFVFGKQERFHFRAAIIYLFILFIIAWVLFVYLSIILTKVPLRLCCVFFSILGKCASVLAFFMWGKVT